MTAFTQSAVPMDLASLARGMAFVRSADPEDLEYGIDDAQMEVAASLVKRDEVCELVIELHESIAFLSWVAGQDIPERQLRAFRALDSRARSIGKMVDERMERAA